MTGTEDGIVVGEFAKNSGETVIVRLVAFHGVQTVDIRAWADFDGKGELRPTKKGLAIKVGLLPELIALLQRAEIDARSRGLLKSEDLAA